MIDTSLRILVAEDNQVNQKVALRLIERFGCRADVAGNGLEAVAAVERQTYDVVFMDVQMPEMDGLEATRAIHQRLATGKRPRIIAMTANAMKGDRERCLDAGMDDYLSKPLRSDALEAALRKCARVGAIVGASNGGGEPPAPEVLSGAVLDRLLAETDAAFVAELASAFYADAPRHLADVRAGIGAGDAPKVRRAAHTLKSNVATLGALRLAAICQELETRGERGDLDGIDELAERAAAELDRALSSLRERVR